MSTDWRKVSAHLQLQISCVLQSSKHYYGLGEGAGARNTTGIAHHFSFLHVREVSSFCIIMNEYNSAFRALAASWYDLSHYSYLSLHLYNLRFKRRTQVTDCSAMQKVPFPKCIHQRWVCTARSVPTMHRAAEGSRKLWGVRVHCSHCFLPYIPLERNNTSLAEHLVTDLQKKNIKAY